MIPGLEGGGCGILNLGGLAERHTKAHLDEFPQEAEKKSFESSQSTLTGADLLEMDFHIFQSREDKVC